MGLEPPVFEYDSDGPYQGPRVTAQLYGEKLYELAERFWPDNTNFSTQPNLLDLLPVPETGRAIITANISDDAGHAYYPSTFLGGNPFILQKTDKYGAIATWPIWVCEKDLSPLECNKTIKQLELNRSSAVAAIYLGWALHFIGDLAQPYHIKNTTGKGHSALEDYADEKIILKLFDHLPVINTTYELETYNDRIYRLQDFRDLEKNGATNIHWSYKKAAQRIIDISGPLYSEVRKEVDYNRKKAALEYLFDAAIKETILAILTFGKAKMPSMETYQIAIKTSNKEGAETHAIPYLIMVGENNGSLLDKIHIGASEVNHAQDDWKYIIYQHGIKPKGLFRFQNSGARFYWTKVDTTRHQNQFGQIVETTKSTKTIRNGFNDRGYGLFKIGHTNNFHLRNSDLGELHGVALGHNGQGQNPTWGIESIEITDPFGDEWYWQPISSDPFWIGRIGGKEYTSKYVEPGFHPDIDMAPIRDISPVLPLARKIPIDEHEELLFSVLIDQNRRTAKTILYLGGWTAATWNSTVKFRNDALTEVKALIPGLPIDTLVFVLTSSPHDNKIYYANHGGRELIEYIKGWEEQRIDNGKILYRISYDHFSNLRLDIVPSYKIAQLYFHNSNIVNFRSKYDPTSRIYELENDHMGETHLYYNVNSGELYHRQGQGKKMVWAKKGQQKMMISVNTFIKNLIDKASPGSLISIPAGDYGGNARIEKKVKLGASGGMVRIGSKK
ncbi:MAG: hypothetical protein ABIE07_09270 [Candidatus Zixiibacteriota bacterium]